MMKYIEEGKFSVLVDGQFGSTGKGLLAAYLAQFQHNRVDFAVTNSSANAGHWTKSKNGRNFCCFHLPTFGVMQPQSTIYLNAGAIINPEILIKEIKDLNVDRNRVKIHPSATIIEKDDIEWENETNSSSTKISSTRKGVGRALARKILRDARTAKNVPELDGMIEKIDLNEEMNRGARVSIEVPQGYSLSIHGGFYPYTTCRQCTVSQGMSDAQVSPRKLNKVSMSIRTFPIRVGNIVENGKNLGYSGGFYKDQKETSWDELGVEKELTTVTKRIRRVFSFSKIQLREAILENSPDILFVNFVNYLKKEDRFAFLDEVHKMSRMLNPEMEFLTGHGPNIEEVSNGLQEST
jgi:adenylosuccinate synthase